MTVAIALHPRSRRPDDPAPGSVNIVARWDLLPIVIRPIVEMDDDDLFEFCHQNADLRIERTREGELIVMPPTGGETGNRNFEIAVALGQWAKQDGSGLGFDSSTGFILPNRAQRAPDAAWITKERWFALPPEKRAKFPPIVPDFIIELRSPSDELADLIEKMEEWIGNGVRLGWLIDPFERRVHVHRPNVEPEVLEEPASVSGNPVLPGFVLRVDDLWADR